MVIREELRKPSRSITNNAIDTAAASSYSSSNSTLSLTSGSWHSQIFLSELLPEDGLHART